MDTHHNLKGLYVSQLSVAKQVWLTIASFFLLQNLSLPFPSKAAGARLCKCYQKQILWPEMLLLDFLFPMTAQVQLKVLYQKYTAYIAYVIFSGGITEVKREKTCLCSELSPICLFLRLIRSQAFLLWLTGYIQENFLYTGNFIHRN